MSRKLIEKAKSSTTKKDRLKAKEPEIQEEHSPIDFRAEMIRTYGCKEYYFPTHKK